MLFLALCSGTSWHFIVKLTTGSHGNYSYSDFSFMVEFFRLVHLVESLLLIWSGPLLIQSSYHWIWYFVKNKMTLLQKWFNGVTGFVQLLMPSNNNCMQIQMTFVNYLIACKYKYYLNGYARTSLFKMTISAIIVLSW